MTTPAYNQLYLKKASRNMGNMLHDAVLEYGMDGTDFLNKFIQSGIAKEIEKGNPKYVAGRSGLELFWEVMEICTGKSPQQKDIETYTYSDVYWVGWMLAHYQWYSGKSFESILAAIPFDDLVSLYHPLHEADIQKCYEVLNSRFS